MTKRKTSLTLRGGTSKITKDFGVKKKCRINQFSRLRSALEVNLDSGLGALEVNLDSGLGALEVNLDSGLGAAQRCTVSELRSSVEEAVGRDDLVVLRRLGSPLPLGEVHSSQSILGDILEEEDLLSRLQRQIEELASSMSLLKQKMMDHDLFLDDGKALAMRAFCDKVVGGFFDFAGVTESKGRWLSSVAAQQFVSEHAGEFVAYPELGGGGFFVSERALKVLRSLKWDSSRISSATCHSSSPIKVAVAVQDLIQFRTDPEFHWLFTEVFKIGAVEMIQTFHAGLGDKYSVSFVA